jgi:hypothetical protein
VLQLGLEEEVQRALERGDAVCISLCFGGVADDEAARELVEAVEDEHRGCLAERRVAPGKPAAKAAGGPGGDRGNRGGGHAAFPSSSVALRREMAASRQRSCSSV